MSLNENGEWMNRYISIYQFIIIIITVAFVPIGCMGISPYENFKAHLRDEIGESIDYAPSYSWRNEKDLIDSKVLPNGNIENKYKYLRSCFYIFEIDPQTRQIIGARFEGSEKDCVVNP